MPLERRHRVRSSSAGNATEETIDDSQESKRSADVPYSEVTPGAVYRSRREFMQTAAAGAVGAVAGGLLGGGVAALRAAPTGALPAQEDASHVDPAVDPLNTFEQITSYNNYYEFGTRKTDPARNAGRLTVKPWTVKVDGLVDKPGNYGVEDLVNFNAARRARLPAALRRSVVDGDSLDRRAAVGGAQQGAAAAVGEVRRVHDARCGRARCPGSDRAASSGRTSRACGWTRRCIR